jgi:hypothetical protein
MGQRFQHLLFRLWLHFQLLLQWQALREKGIRVKKRGWLLVIDGKQPPKCLSQKSRIFVARRRSLLKKSAQAPTIQPNFLSPSSQLPLQ